METFHIVFSELDSKIKPVLSMNIDAESMEDALVLFRDKKSKELYKVEAIVILNV